jgi:aspartate/methionine/tyrosine aminotransferase
MYPDFRLERFFARHEFSARHLLCASDCESISIGELLDLEPGAQDRFLKLKLGYTESTGHPELRRAIAGIYKTVDADDVLVFSGAQEAITLFLQGMLGAEDHAIVHWPCYQSLYEVAADAAGAVDRWEADADNHWKLDIEKLLPLIRTNTRVIVVNTPHNPTGYLMPAADWRELHRIAASWGILVFCDEVYRESEYDPAERLPAGCEMGDHAVSLGVMSKTYGLAGLRIGWVATKNGAVMDRLRSMKDYTSICNSAPSEFLAELGLRHRQRLVDRNLKIIRGNLDLLDRFFDEFRERFVWHRPRAGAIAFPKLVGQPIDDFCEAVLRETGVLLAPGSMFHDPGNHFRIGFGRASMAEGLEALGEHLRSSAEGG